MHEVTTKVTVFALRLTRKADEIQSLLGAKFCGTLTWGRATMYLTFPNIQWCWAHLRRDFIERETERGLGIN